MICKNNIRFVDLEYTNIVIEYTIVEKIALFLLKLYNRRYYLINLNKFTIYTFIRFIFFLFFNLIYYLLNWIKEIDF